MIAGMYAIDGAVLFCSQLPIVAADSYLSRHFGL
jgi:hypothetical protein